MYVMITDSLEGWRRQYNTGTAVCLVAEVQVLLNILKREICGSSQKWICSTLTEGQRVHTYSCSVKAIWQQVWPNMWLLTERLDLGCSYLMFCVLRRQLLCLIFVLVKNSFAFPLLFGLEYIRVIRNIHEVNVSICWMLSQLYLLSLVGLFLNLHSFPKVQMNMSGQTQHFFFSVTVIKHFD